MGEHVKYSEQLADKLCERLASGESMRRICSSKGMPNRQTVVRWMDADETFAARCARARDIGLDERADALSEEIDSEPDVQRARLKLDYGKWYLSKLAPKKYGDKLELGGTGPNGEHIHKMGVEVTFVRPTHQD
jgi:hypothetical protein